MFVSSATEHEAEGAAAMAKDARASGAVYGPQYSRFDTATAVQIRREVYEGDIGQQGWRTAAEQTEIAEIIGRGPNVHVLDIACGSGGPSLALVERNGCRLTGLDVETAGIAHAQAHASARGLSTLATFAVLNCSGRLPFDNGAFDAILCIDAISHLSERFQTLAEWARLLRPGGRLVCTDAFVLTGPVAVSELDMRTTNGPHLVVPPGLNEKCIEDAGLTLMRCEDRTAAVAELAGRWIAARSRRAEILKREEGADWFEERQRFLSVTAELAASRRLSRILYVADKPG
jgi:SAM-dependent methyltransferase